VSKPPNRHSAASWIAKADEDIEAVKQDRYILASLERHYSESRSRAARRVFAPHGAQKLGLVLSSAYKGCFT
jgi:hypothetical protein